MPETTVRPTDCRERQAESQHRASTRYQNHGLGRGDVADRVSSVVFLFSFRLTFGHLLTDLCTGRGQLRVSQLASYQAIWGKAYLARDSHTQGDKGPGDFLQACIRVILASMQRETEPK